LLVRLSGGVARFVRGWLLPLVSAFGGLGPRCSGLAFAVGFGFPGAKPSLFGVGSCRWFPLSGGEALVVRGWLLPLVSAFRGRSPRCSGLALAVDFRFPGVKPAVFGLGSCRWFPLSAGDPPGDRPCLLPLRPAFRRPPHRSSS